MLPFIGKIAANPLIRRSLSRLALPPGRYQIHVGAHESSGAAIGTVPYDIEIPDYAKSAFELSGVLLTSSNADSFVTSNPDPLLKDALPTSPVATRTFSQGETLTAYAELYAGSGPARAAVGVPGGHAEVVQQAVGIEREEEGLVAQPRVPERPVEQADVLERERTGSQGHSRRDRSRRSLKSRPVGRQERRQEHDEAPGRDLDGFHERVPGCQKDGVNVHV